MDLLGCYSKRTLWTKRLQLLPDLTNGDPGNALRRRRAAATTLPAADVAALVDAYQTGATIYQLATRFKIHRMTVSQHLHRQGVTLRRCGLTDEQYAHAVRLYREGHLLARVGARLGFDAETIRQALRAHGIHIRKPWERG